MSLARVALFERPGGPIQATGLQLLAELQSAHSTLLACVALMEGVTATRVPDPVELTQARFKISQASLARRVLWRRIQEHLLCRVQGADCGTLCALTERDLQQFQRSSAHVAKWTIAAVLADWKAYQAASKDIRRQLVSGVRAEQNSLYPLLHRYR